MRPVEFLICALLCCLLGCGSDGDGPTPDATPPAKVADFHVIDNTLDVVTLGWTAPGDDGATGQASVYGIRYSQTPIDEARWDSSSTASALPLPQRSGQSQSLTISRLQAGTWWFGLKSADEIPNWSLISNVVSVAVSGDPPPGQITDLAVVTQGATSISLRWTASGSDGTVGTAGAYDLRYSVTPITESNWPDAIPAQGVPLPRSSGSPEVFAVTGLERSTTYYFAIRTIDDTPTWSELSNVAAAFTQERERLTTSPATDGAFGADWSSDGSRIVFVADWDRLHYEQVYTIAPEGGDAEKLTDEPEGVFSAAWSPDGRRLAIVIHREKRQQLWIMEAEKGAQPVQLVAVEDANVGVCAWSPDGTRIAYSLVVSPGVSQIRTVEVEGGLTELLVDHPSRNGYPDWSPNGQQIAFSSNRGGTYDIWIVPSTGGDPIRLTDAPGFDLWPTWSPDGTRIAFGSDRGGNEDIWQMSATGGEVTQLTFESAAESKPSWSPDGTRIAFGSLPEGASSDIWLLSLE